MDHGIPAEEVASPKGANSLLLPGGEDRAKRAPSPAPFQLEGAMAIMENDKDEPAEVVS